MSKVDSLSWKHCRYGGYGIKGNFFPALSGEWEMFFGGECVCLSLGRGGGGGGGGERYSGTPL